MDAQERNCYIVLIIIAIIAGALAATYGLGYWSMAMFGL
jgi:hypothetical protein